jgi:hypothetical protein
MKNILSIFCLLIFTINYTLAQPQLVKQRCIGYKGNDMIADVIQNIDATFWATMEVGDSIPEFWDAPFVRSNVLIKYDTSLTIVDKKYFGGSNGKTGITHIVRNEDNSIFLLGSTTATNGDCIGGTGHDMLVIKCDSNMNKIWSKCYPTCISFGERGIISAVDKGALISFVTNCPPQGIIPTHYGSTMLNDAGLMRIDSVGNLIWVKMYGGSDIDGITSDLIKMDNIHYRIDINSYSIDYDFAGTFGNTDTLKHWMFILDTAGNISKSKIVRGYINHYGQFQHTVLSNNKVEMIAVGLSTSPLYPTTPTHQKGDAAIIVYDSSFTIKSMKQWGGNGDDFFYSYCRDSSGNFYFGGRTSSTNGDITSTLHSKYDFWILKTDSNLITQWSRTFGGGDFSSENFTAPTKLYKNKNKLYFFGYCTPLPRMPDMDITCGTNSGIQGYLSTDGWIGVFDLNTTIGIESLFGNQIKPIIFPNPTQRSALISSSTAIKKLSLFNLLGNQIQIETKMKSENEAELSTESLSAGLYILKIEDKLGNICSTKLIKE